MKAINISDSGYHESTNYTETFKIAISGNKEKVSKILNVSFFDASDTALKIVQGVQVSKQDYRRTRSILRDIYGINIKSMIIHNPKR